MKPQTTILIIFLIVVLSCKKNDSCDPNSPTIIGSWSWVKSVGGIGGDTYTPDITGETRAIEITIDSTYREYLNKSLIAESKFTLAYDTHSGKPYLKFDRLSSLSFELIDCNNLILNELYICDGFTYTYKRIP